MANDEKHRYYANAIGAVAFFTFLIFITRGCSSAMIEVEKTKQIQIINSKNK